MTHEEKRLKEEVKPRLTMNDKEREEEERERERKGRVLS